MDYDYVLVGGGLQSGLIALAVLHAAPQARIAMIEREPTLGGNHTWCFHAHDVPDDARSWVEPLVVHRWDSYDVLFPDYQRTLEQSYAAITSERLDSVVRERLSNAGGCTMHMGVAAESVGGREATLAGGRRVTGRVVVDARGPSRTEVARGTGFQKFVGLEVRLHRASGIARPVVMDATVGQQNGYRFMYVLPFAEDRILVEDTYFSNDPGLKREKIRGKLLAYLAEHTLEVAEVLREEHGVLPMPWSAGAVSQHDGDSGLPLFGGYRGGWFHPATGYSFPSAVRFARVFARTAPDPPRPEAMKSLRQKHEEQARFARRLNWLLFRTVPPRLRWRIFRRFYRLPGDTILNFYALEMTRTDRVRVLLGHARTHGI